MKFSVTVHIDTLDDYLADAWNQADQALANLNGISLSRSLPDAVEGIVHAAVEQALPSEWALTGTNITERTP